MELKKILEELASFSEDCEEVMFDNSEVQW